MHLFYTAFDVHLNQLKQQLAELKKKKKNWKKTDLPLTFSLQNVFENDVYTLFSWEAASIESITLCKLITTVVHTPYVGLHWLL